MLKNKFLHILFILTMCSTLAAQETDIRVGAEQTERYLPSLRGKRVALVANHSSLIGKVHLVDTLVKVQVRLKKIFCPEHGFRGNDEAGEFIKNHVDVKSGIPVVSLYGNTKKPTEKDLKGIDVVLFDMQDVGVRFYTYISTMHYVMEACAEQDIPIIILDRPNPNGFYIDGPVLDPACKSFVGLHPVPIVHGMTIAEFAQMINGEKWLKDQVQCKLTIIPCLNYDHIKRYTLPVKPSPNLPNQQSIFLYPSLGLFEGTVVSVGRGTDFPFQIFGHPLLPDTGFSFIPIEKPGASKNPPCKDQKCFGTDLRNIDTDSITSLQRINIEWLINVYTLFPDKNQFFNSYFQNLAGNTELRKQIESGLSADEIHSTWRKPLENFREIRKKYLIYPDF